jgi:hypothetical protein
MGAMQQSKQWEPPARLAMSPAAHVGNMNAHRQLQGKRVIVTKRSKFERLEAGAWPHQPLLKPSERPIQAQAAHVQTYAEMPAGPPSSSNKPVFQVPAAGAAAGEPEFTITTAMAATLNYRNPPSTCSALFRCDLPFRVVPGDANLIDRAKIDGRAEVSISNLS